MAYTREDDAVKLLAVSDLHVSHPKNKDIVSALPASPADWLLIAGDVGETPDQLAWTLETLKGRFRQIVWTPGNHELWTTPADPVQLRGEARYQHLVELCRSHGVLTPEDDYQTVEFDSGTFTVVPLTLLYDYTFRPPGTTAAQAIEAAAENGIVCTDEYYLHADPYPSIVEWCHARVAQTAARLDRLDPGVPTVLVGHFPMRRDLAVLPRIPQFSLWCGTDRTEDWHVRYRAAVVVTGHRHMPGTNWRDGVPFVEPALGYPREWEHFPRRPLPWTVVPLPTR